MTGFGYSQTSDSRPETPVFHLECRIHRWIYWWIYRCFAIKQANLEPVFDVIWADLLLEKLDF
jgi:hypothetical protein